MYKYEVISVDFLVNSKYNEIKSKRDRTKFIFNDFFTHPFFTGKHFLPGYFHLTSRRPSLSHPNRIFSEPIRHELDCLFLFHNG